MRRLRRCKNEDLARALSFPGEGELESIFFAIEAMDFAGTVLKRQKHEHALFPLLGRRGLG